MNTIEALHDRSGLRGLAYAAFAYIVFILTIVYSVAFLGNLMVARTIDAAAVVSLGKAFLVNSGLLVFFALQHSGMARKPFKRWLCRRMDRRLERSSYVLASSLAILLLMALWQPMGGVVWSVTGPVVAALIYGFYFAGWALMLHATFLLDHLELFGLRQVWAAYRGIDCDASKFKTPGLYRRVRHPVCLGWLMVLWASPVMTVTHLLFAAGMTIYVFIGIQLEEHDLLVDLPDYRQYRRKVPMLLPSWRKYLR